jgi:branched-chain amino acid transport system permease protein
VLISSKIGRVIIAAKENEQRVLLLGYDARAYKLFSFTLGGAIAGLAGCLFANWGAFTSPTIFGLGQSAQIIIWVIVGGRGTLFGPILACVGLQALMARLGEQQAVDSGLVLGVILLTFVMLLPRGLLPSLASLAARAFTRRPAPSTVAPQEQRA